MKKLMILGALLALALVAATPAVAKVSNAAGGDTGTSGNVTTPFTATNSGSSSDQCAGAEKFANSGNNQPTQGVEQYDSKKTSAFGGINETGGSFNFAPSNTQTCTQAVQQSSAASSQ